MKKNYILFLFTLLFVCTTNAQITLSQSTSETIVAGSVACGAAGVVSDNIFYRAFDINALGYPQFDVTEVAFGIEAVTNESVGFAVDVVIYETTAFPAGTLTELARVSVPLVTADTGTIKIVPITASVTADILVFTVETPDESGSGGTTGFQIGSNNLGQSASGFLSSVACGLTTPTDISLVGFPDMHMVMTVTSDPLSVDEFSFNSLSVSPNPTSDILNLEMPNSITEFNTEIYSVTGKLVYKGSNKAQLDLSNLNSGVYILKVTTDNGTVSKKVIRY
ncbi:hypothetical protein A9Q86_04560 [Flavobacteriales bacterium 33_180_T64]|nr:hypothetical protein A9Q86_04560 [Flavobacteriales bacterium 33_180_T64]